MIYPVNKSPANYLFMYKLLPPRAVQIILKTCPIITKFCTITGTWFIIFVDFLRNAYKSLDQNEYVYQTVNLQNNFIDLTTRAHSPLILD